MPVHRRRGKCRPPGRPIRSGLDEIADDLVGQAHHAIIHQTHADGSAYPVDDCPIHQAYRDGKVHFGADEVFWHKNGQGFPVDYISTPIHENRQLRGAVVVFRDLTALTRLRTGEESS